MSLWEGNTIRCVHCLRAPSNYEQIVSAVYPPECIRQWISYQRDNVCGLRREFVGQLFVIRNQMGDINVAVVLLHQGILSKLVSV